MGELRGRVVLALAVAAGSVGLGGLVGATTPAQALLSTYYVSASGSDAAAGTQAAPWRTIAKATATAPEGATIRVASGDYGPFRITKALQTVTADAGADVRVTGAPGVQDVVRVSGTGATVSGLHVSGCVPNPTPATAFDVDASSAVRVDANGVTVSGLTISDSRGTNQHGLPFGCYGVFAYQANATRIRDNDISGTGTGVYLKGGGRLSVIDGNRIHDNDVLIRNTPGGGDDYGANGITFSGVDALPGALATRNTITGNSGPSADYTYDGGAFEIYDSSHVQMVDNTIADNENVLETGTGPDGTNPLGECRANSFVGNTVTGRTAGSDLERSIGMILRCATAMVITGNTFTDVDYYVYDIFTGDQFSSDVLGLAITGNSVDGYQKVYSLAVDPLRAGLVIDANRFSSLGPVFASYGDGSTSPTLADWQARTQRDLLSTS